MSTRPVPTAQFTTTGDVRLSKHAAGIDQTFFALECRVTAATGAGVAAISLPVDLPANAQIDHIHLHPFAALVFDTGTGDAVGVGVAADPDEYADILGTTVDVVGENVTTIATRVAPTNAAKTLQLHATLAGVTDGTMECDYGVRITGVIVNPIATV